MPANPIQPGQTVEKRGQSFFKLLSFLGVLVLTGVLIAGSVLLYHLSLADLFAFQANREYRAGRYENALMHLELSFQHWTRDPDAYQTYAQALRGLAQREKHRATLLALLREAGKAYTKAIQLNPEEGDYWFGLARLRWRLDTLESKPNPEQSLERLLLMAREKDPNNARYLFLLAHHFLSVGDQAKAGLYIKHLAGASPEKLLRLRHHPKWGARQESDFHDGLTANRSNALVGVEILSTLANAAAEKKKWDEAVKYIQGLINLLGDDVSSFEYERLTNYALQKGDNKLALEAFRKSVALSPTPEKRLLTLFWHFVRAEELGLYKAELKNLAGEYADIKSHLPFIMGQAQFYSNQLDKAEANFEQYLDKHQSLEAHRYLAEIALKREDWPQAEYNAYRAIKIDPKDFRSHYLLSLALNSRGRYKEALAAINTAMRLRGEEVGFYYDHRGWIDWNLDKIQEAVDDWQKAVELEPNRTDTLYWIAKAYLKLNQPVKAREYLEKAAKAMPEDPRVKKELARLNSRGKGR